MNKNISNGHLVRKIATRNEFYTTQQTAYQFVSPLGDAGLYVGKHIFCNCDGQESEIYKLLKKNFQKWHLESLEACQYNKDGFGIHTIYNKDTDQDIVEILPDNGSFDSPSSLEILGRSDMVVTNPPFSKQSNFISMLMNLDKKFSIICNMMKLANKPTIGYLLDGKLKIFYNHPGGATFTRPNGDEVCVCVTCVTNIEEVEDHVNIVTRKPTMTKAQLLEKGVLYHPDGMPDNHYEVRFVRHIPIDLKEDEVVWVPISALLAPWYINHYSVQKDMTYDNKSRIKVDGKQRFYRFPIKVKV